MSRQRLDWSAAILLDRTVPNERDRNRIAAGAGLLFVVAGFMIAVGLAVVVLAAVALTVAIVGGRLGVRAIRSRVGDRNAAATIRTLGHRVKPIARTSAERMREKTTKVVTDAHAAGTRIAASRPTPSRDRYRLQKEALRLNTAGSDARRRGEPQRASELHLDALEVVRALGDRTAEALTLNNLALALGAAGDEDASIARFSEAHAVASELDAPKYEGLIAANLATAYRRRGYEQQAVQFLHVALEKLPPSSGAYHRVEEELQRAS
jgi:tetratricopeptide (TPR) repeat protein